MRAIALAFIAAAAGASVVAQQTPTVFRGGVELVAVDFMAVDTDGRPVTDLRPADVQLTVDGRTRPIQSLQFVRVVSEDVAEGVAATRAPVPPPYAVNSVEESGRSVILLVHHESIRPGNERQATSAASRFLDGLAPYDRVALVTIPNGKVEVDLTTDRERVRAALKNVVGHTTTAGSRAGPKAAWLAEFLDGLKAIDGPKTVVFISNNLGVDTTNPEDLLDLKEVAKAAGAARAQFYILEPHDFGSDAGTAAPASVEGTSAMSVALSGLQDLAGMTGGELFRLSGRADEAFTHINRESSAYYLLGFTPDADERNGKSHRIEVRVSRPRVTVRSRPEFTIPKAAAAAPPPVTLPSMLRETKPYHELPLRALAYGSRDPGTPSSIAVPANGPPLSGGAGRSGLPASPSRRAPSTKIKVVVVADTLVPGTPLKSVSFAIVDEKGKVAAIWPADAKELSTRPIVSSTVVTPGRYRLRVAAADADDHHGTVDYDFDASLVKAGPVQIGALMIGAVSASGVFDPRLDFDNAATVTGYVEIYGALPKNSALSVTIELADSVDGPAVVRATATMKRTAEVDRFIARGALPLSKLAPADYVIRAIVSVNDKPVGRVIRTMRKVR